MGLDRRTVADEFHRLAKRQGLRPEDFLPRDFYIYEVELVELLDLREKAARDVLGLQQGDLSSDELRTCQLVGESAHHAGREGILAPSAADGGTVLAVFLDRMLPGSAVRDVAVELWDVPPRLG